MPAPLLPTLRRQSLLARAPGRALGRVVRELIGVQAQYEPAAGLALAARLEGFTAARLSAALYHDHTLLKMWSLRGTLHLVAPQDWKLLIAIYGPRYHRDWSVRAYDLEVRELEGYIYPAMLEALSDGPRTYKQLLAHLQTTVGHRYPRLSRYFNSWGGIVRGLCFQGKAVLVDSVGAETRVARAETWLAPEVAAPYPGTQEDAVVELLRRYLHTYGPASPADFQYWTLLERPLMRAAWARLAGQLVEIPGKRPRYWLRADAAAAQRAKSAASRPPLRLLPKFDPLTLMHKDKDGVVAPAHYKNVFRIAGQIEATLLWNGRLAGTWRYARRGGALEITLYPFAPLPRAAHAALKAEAANVARYWGLQPLLVVRPPP